MRFVWDTDASMQNRWESKRWLAVAFFVLTGTANAGEQFDLVCENGAVLGHFIEGQTMASARNGDRPLKLFYCPVNQTLHNIRRDSERFESLCTQPLELVDGMYMNESQPKPFPPCHGGYLAERKITMWFD
ncbi:hypothetical protein VOM14_00140 [Paraburkholderia sp. MPAMCS5]|uniref:hypothetical protein n=1 Tax=Paraburkholderia sp. MPAMCS5 TaxID=3112563 RepID=UPI002E16C315|nr:hypothetical protein [Paraburkholderia sp. MPAMCS5]